MIEFKIKGHILRLTNAEWANVRKRFNPENAILAGWTYRIRVACSLCCRYKLYDRSCRSCPFAVFASKEEPNGCMRLIKKIFPAQCFWPRGRDVYWDRSDNYKARRQLNSLLGRMKKTEEAQ